MDFAGSEYSLCTSWYNGELQQLATRNSNSIGLTIDPTLCLILPLCKSSLKVVAKNTMTPTITTDRLLLRPWREEDVGPLHRILPNEEVLRYFPPSPPPRRQQVAGLVARQLLHWAHYGYGWWAVEQLDDIGGLCGWCGLQYLTETKETEVGYLLDKHCWGKGFATEGARAALSFGFEHKGLDCIVGLIHPDNLASGRVLEKSGLHYTRRRKYFGMICCRYEIVKRTWEVPHAI